MDIYSLLNKEKIIRIKPDVMFIKKDDGTHIRSLKGSFLIRGKTSYKICNWLRDRLNANITFREVIKAVPNNLFDFIIKLTATLIQHDCAKIIVLEKNSIPPFLLKKHEEKIDFLENYVDCPRTALRIFINTPVVCKATESLIKNIKLSLSEFGILNANIEKMKIIQFKTAGKILLELSANKFFGYIIETPKNLILTVQKHKFLAIKPISNKLKEVSISKVCAKIAANNLTKILFYHITKINFQEEFSILCINKNNLNMTYHRNNIFYNLLNYSLDLSTNYILNLNNDPPIRVDIPTATDDTLQLSYLEKINQFIPYLVDHITGPILRISEERYEQIPLATLTCKILYHIKTDMSVLKIKCFGISARETRNQIVLYALENFFYSFKDLSLKIPNSISNILVKLLKSDKFYLGVGWSWYEALYRGLCNFVNSHDFFKRPIKNSYRYELDEVIGKMHPIGRYLLDCYLDKRVSLPIIYWTRIYECLFLAYSNPTLHTLADSPFYLNKNKYAIGLTLEHAVLNLLHKLLIDALHKKENNSPKEKNYSSLLWTGFSPSFFENKIEIIIKYFKFYNLKFHLPRQKDSSRNFFIFLVKEKENE